MRDVQIEALSELKTTFEREEDWVAVGHVAYLLERLAEQGISDRRFRVQSLSSLMIH